jgi:hypothetical protein
LVPALLLEDALVIVEHLHFEVAEEALAVQRLAILTETHVDACKCRVTG